MRQTIFKALRITEPAFNIWREYKREVERNRDAQGIVGNLTDSMLIEMVVEAQRKQEQTNDR